MKKLSLLILVFLLVYPYAFAQDIVVTPKEKLSKVKEDNKIEVKENEHKHPTKINFVCSSSGDICKSIDIEKENPFANLDYPIRNISKGTHRISYDLHKIPYKKIVKEFFSNVKNALTYPCPPKYATSSHRIVTADKHVFIFADIVMTGSNGSGIASNTHIYKYNKNGELVCTIENVNEGPNTVIITKDGRYLTYKYGGFGGPHGDCIVGGSSPYGIKIIDTHTGEIVVDEQPYRDKPHNKSPNWIGIRSGYINIAYKLHDGKGRELVFFDFEKNRRYAKSFALKEYWHLKEFTNEGMIFYDMHSMPDTSKKKIYLFEKDFEQTPIK